MRNPAADFFSLGTSDFCVPHTTHSVGLWRVCGTRAVASCMGPGAILVLCLLLTPCSAMRLVVQRVKSASVMVDGTVVSSIGRGVLALVGLHAADTPTDLSYCAKKLCGSKLWANEDGKGWRKSAKQLDLDVLLVSQFTLYGTVANKKHVPDFKRSMKSEAASHMYDSFKVAVAAELGCATRVKDGVFGAMMDVALVNDGPVTLVIESEGDGGEAEGLGLQNLD